MAKNKTMETAVTVTEFLESFVETEQKRADSWEFIRLMQRITGEEPKMWGPSIIGFGHYHYKYASGHEGDAPLIGFSPRKSAHSLYVFTGLEEHEHLLEGLGAFKRGKACIYVKKFTDIHADVLEKLIVETILFLRNTYGVVDANKIQKT
ncbi:DUF1801 domain-containing protein [Flavobacterium sp. JP2137]|uniref:DUF1801 domain-containing protein n=1 Tax=Flavobacterium sp. JP2137 TaxID=3414510 RepID=UPI003D300B69